MYGLKDYLRRATTFANNQAFPSRKRLSTLMIYTTDLCDSACKHCLIWAKRPIHFMPFTKIVEVMQSKCITKNTAIGLEGGEFMLHPEALKILEWFYENHKNFDLLSNCLKPDELIDAVKKYPPKRLYVSLDGTADTYLYMRGKPGYESVLKVIKELKDIVPVSVMFTLSPYNDFEDMQHVAEVCKKHSVDLRIGIYNDIAFFDTTDKAHDTFIGSLKHENAPLKVSDIKILKEDGGAIHTIKTIKKQEVIGDITTPKHDYKNTESFTDKIPAIVKEFSENYDFLVLYNEWRKNSLRLRCYSILDSLVILPDGKVPICQNLDFPLGNIYQNTLDEIFNGTETIQIQKVYVHNCNQCWLNFHRKYDVILYRTFEKYFGRFMTSKLFGYYCWEGSGTKTYDAYFKEKSV